MKNLTHIVSLKINFGYNNISASGVKYLSSAIKKLEKLSFFSLLLEKNQINSYGLMHLSD